MVIGNGMIARAFAEFQKIHDVVIFASGVSDSKTTKAGDFLREKNLLTAALSNLNEKTIVYFSTCSVHDPSLNKTDYVFHKIEMENLIKVHASSFHLFRLPQVVGPTKSPTLINFLCQKIKKREEFVLWKNSVRNLIGISDVVKLCSYLINNNLYRSETVDVATPFNMTIPSIVRILEDILKIEARYTVEEKGADYSIDLGKIDKYVERAGVIFDEKYPVRILSNYI